MSDSDEKTPIVPPDQGATSMTATVVPKELESEWLQFLKQKKEKEEYDKLVSDVNKEYCKAPWLIPHINELGNYENVSQMAKAQCAAPPLPPSEKDNFVEMEESLKNQRSWFLKQNEELLKLLDSLHKQEYDEVVQEEEILDRISDFTLVLFEYVKTLKKRKGRGAVCV